MGARLPDHGKGPDDQHAPQVSIALLGDGSQPLLAAGRILARDDADPGREVTPRLEDRSIRNRGDNGTRARTPMPGMLSSRLLSAFLRCCARRRFSMAPISAWHEAICATSAERLARAFSGRRTSLLSAMTASSTFRPS